MEKARQLAQAINSKTGLILLDFPSLEKTCLDRKGLVVTLLNLFVKQTPGWIKELQESFREQNPERMRKVCHTVNGATAAIHANACVDSVRQLHSIVKDQEGELKGAQEALNEVVFVFEKTKDATVEILKEFS